MLLLGHWPALVGADARLFELRPVAGIDGSSLMGHRVGSCAFSPITLVDSAIPIISVLEPPEEALHDYVVDSTALPSMLWSMWLDVLLAGLDGLGFGHTGRTLIFFMRPATCRRLLGL